MGKIEITNSKLMKSFRYENENLVVNGNVQQDTDTTALKSIDGTCYRKSDQEEDNYVCNFNGHDKNGKISYNMSDMSLDDTSIVVEAISDIEAQLKSND